ncbi:CRISPR-associated helicase Cas3' [Paenibacillus athensensis]|nr:CRISPR-associated helicase Cas3' [Paenibacillus athensensis]MCD1258064.1 CRISPR-associated helicase Cas3' [Paenibacillus athensensis]
MSDSAAGSQYYAHRTDSANKEDWQTLKAHLEGVAKLAKEFAAQFGAGEWGWLVGMLHDVGKFSKEFQRRLEGERLSVDHATAGAQYLDERWKKLGANAARRRIASYVIAGHHAGLADYGTPASIGERALCRRLLKTIREYKMAFEQEMKLELNLPELQLGTSLHEGLQLSLFIRMIFSCLVDADSLNTEEYADQEKFAARGKSCPLHEFWPVYEQYMRTKFAVSRHPVDPLRAELREEILRAADKPPGLFELTLPTGAGKTLIALGFALKHAVEHSQMRRIIFVLPYANIIEQNAAVFREVLGREAVLEHHSNVRHEKDDEDTELDKDYAKMSQKLALAADNWDCPVVVTTNVQFFETLFSNKRTRCRKLHNYANSIIVIDEAQMMNGEFFRPCLYALEELSRNYGSTVVFSTATQPPIKQLFENQVHLQPLVADPKRRFEQFERVHVTNLGSVDTLALAERIAGHEQALCIVNTRRASRELYEEVRKIFPVSNKHVFHLSARMCAAHRQNKLRRIRKRLRYGLPCLLISTQLVECGVDIDFPVVYRELAGLDAIAQAAGRCNRHGRLEAGEMYVFEGQLSSGKEKWLDVTASTARLALEKYKGKELSVEAIRFYFRRLYSLREGAVTQGGASDAMDKMGILPLLDELADELMFPFDEVARRFKLIPTVMKPVIVDYKGQARPLLDKLRHAQWTTGIMRELQPYVVQLYASEFEAFRKAQELEEIREGVFCLRDTRLWYKDDIGVEPFLEEFRLAEIYAV